MRALSAMIFLAVCGLLVIVYQAVQQELNIRNLKMRMVVSSDQVKLKEDAIVAAKVQAEEINKKLSSVNAQRDAFKKQRDDSKKAFAESEKELGTCSADKDKLEKQSRDAKDELQKIKEGQESERRKAEEEIEGLKQKILERDLKICDFVDLKVEEAKKLCSGVSV